jgi:hypothetical protein
MFSNSSEHTAPTVCHTEENTHLQVPKAPIFFAIMAKNLVIRPNQPKLEKNERGTNHPNLTKLGTNPAV